MLYISVLMIFSMIEIYSKKKRTKIKHKMLFLFFSIWLDLNYYGTNQSLSPTFFILSGIISYTVTIVAQFFMEWGEHLRKKEFYEKPSVKRKKKSEAARKRSRN